MVKRLNFCQLKRLVLKKVTPYKSQYYYFFLGISKILPVTLHYMESLGIDFLLIFRWFKVCQEYYKLETTFLFLMINRYYEISISYLVLQN